jgi:hypothetical protein
MISSYDVLQMQTGLQNSFMVTNQQNYQAGNPYTYPPPRHNLPYSPFSYRGNENGYGMGNQAGMGAVGAMQGGYQAANAGLALGGAAMGFKMGGFRGAIRGGMMAGGPMMAAGMMAGGHVFGNMMEGAEEQQAIQSTLGRNFNFINGGSRTGRGFSRQDTKGISDFVREMQSVPEMMTSMNELNQIMQKVSQMGVMGGVRNAQEFQKRFKETVSTLKDVSKIMATSMEDATKFFEEARRSGIYSPQMIRQNSMQRQFTAGVTGMSQDQVGALQFAGSQISFGYGGTRGSGAQSALRSARQIGMANEMGMLSNERIEELTGMSGSAGISSMATSMTDAAQRMSVGGLGTAMSIALAKQDKSGRFTGAMDDDLVQKVRMGGLSKSELLSMAQKKTSSRRSAMSFKANQNMLRSEMASQVGAEGVAMELGDILGGAGFSNPDALNIVMQKYGVDERQAKMITEMGQKMPDIQRELGSRGQIEGRRIAEQSYLKENLSNEAIKRKIYKKLENTFSEPFKHMGANISNAVSSYVDNFMDSLIDRHSVNISKEVSSLASGALGGSSGARAKMGTMIKEAGSSTFASGPVKVGTGERMLEMWTDQRSDKMNRYDMLEGLKGKGLASERQGIVKGLFGSSQESLGLTQSAQQIAGTKKYLGDLQNYGSKEFGSKIAKDDAFALDTFNVSKGIGEVLRKHGAEMKNMSQMERVQFIKGKIGESKGLLNTHDLALNRLTGKGASIEELISHAQRQEGMTDYIGAVNFNKLSGEMYNTGEFGSAGQLSAAEKGARGELSKMYGDKSGQVEALLGGDTKERSLFLAAASGNDPEAVKLLTRDMAAGDKQKLLSKYGVDEKGLENIQSLYGSAKGDVRGLAKNMSGAINRSALGGLAAQLRRQGGDMNRRLESSGLAGPEKDLITKFADKLSGLTSGDKMQDLLGSEKGGQEMSYLLDSVSKLKGDARSKALGVLGSGASAAIGYGENVSENARSKAGLARIKQHLPEDLQEYVDQHAKGGVLSAKDAQELGKMARDRTFAGSLSASGEAKKQDVQSSFNREMLDKLNIFAQTTNQFANLVVQATPQLDQNVKAAQANVTSSSQQIQSLPAGKM